MRSEAEKIFMSGVKSVLPINLINSKIKLTGNILQIAGNSFQLNLFNHVYILSVGKAAALMAEAVENILGEWITDGHVLTKYGHGRVLKHLTLSEAGHPIPDNMGVEGTQRIINIAQKANQDDLVICLISGGASALMADFPSGASLQDLKQVNKILVNCGANISEINTVRKHLSKVKGGHLAKTIYPATTISLIISDVVNDRLDVIASGPTVEDPSTFEDALAVINKYSLENTFPPNLLHYLEDGLNGLISETPKPGDPIFKNVQNHIIGNNMIALESAANKAQMLGFKTKIVTNSLQGDYIDVSDFIIDTISSYIPNKLESPICLLFGGEPTIKVLGNGTGGRSQHLALFLTTKITHMKELTILCAGTDGTDGPTNVAGAIVDKETALIAKSLNIDLYDYLSNSNSYAFFQNTGGHVIIGNTRTNVMDIIVVLINS